MNKSKPRVEFRVVVSGLDPGSIPGRSHKEKKAIVSPIRVTEGLAERGVAIVIFDVRSAGFALHERVQRYDRPIVFEKRAEFSIKFAELLFSGANRLLCAMRSGARFTG